MKYDPTLLTAAQGGDTTAMEALLKKIQPDIRRYARYQCSRATAIDDVVQETLIIVHRKIGSVNNLAAFAGWIARIVARLCLLPALQLLRAAESIAIADKPEDLSFRSTQDLRIDVVRAIESLPDHYREVAIMRDFEELTIREMAQRLGLSRAATKSRIHRARAMIREYLITRDPTEETEHE